MGGKSRSIIDVMKVADTGSFMTAVPRGVIPVLDAGMTAILRHTAIHSRYLSIDSANK
ncbi:hypothetical protein [Wolbachia endosymbiont of Glossina morsitans morsitans]|uniref:hypothetical protein n=1 Tax=Wolbachia endosymbiont of Glossina morsitans morsitans TaxID=1150948 RepID=UPI001F11E755|nr:hypothetical protein [Wolbachia endosymbiont of Glossina morsitans morsitans]